LIFFHPGKNSMLTRPMLNIRILFTNYDIITYFLNLVFCSEHFISIKHQILATFNINKKFNSDSLCAFMFRCFRTVFPGILLYIYSNNWLSSCFPLISGEGNYLCHVLPYNLSIVGFHPQTMHTVSHLQFY
jgi:hypothetical protein